MEMNMEETNKWRSARIDALWRQEDFGSRKALGLALGYADGSFIGQMIRGERPVTEKTIEQIEGLRGGKFAGWFTLPSVPEGSPPLFAAQSGSDVLVFYTVPPMATAEDVMEKRTAREYRFALMDDAMAPDHPKGAQIIFSGARTPKPGRLVLIKTGHGELHARMYSQGKVPGEWRATPTQVGYAEFSSADPGVELMAAYCGVYEPE